jgi:hypothetical protein
MPHTMPRPAENSVTIPGTGTELDLSDLSPQIATELAAQLLDAEGVCEKYGLTTSQWNRLRVNPIFRGMLKEAMSAWHGDLNAGTRITKKAEIVLEEAIPVLDTMIHNHQLHPDVRLSAVKQVESLTGRKTTQNGLNAAGMFNLTINIGDGKGVIIEGEPVTDPDA